MQLSNRVNSIKPSATLEIAGLARELKNQGHDIISLSTGEPDFDTPEIIKQAAINAILAGQTKYTEVDGTQEFKKAIQQKFKVENNLFYELNQIMASAGAKQILYNATQAILNPGDEAIIPAPYWVSYPDMVSLTGAKPVIIPTTQENSFKITGQQLEEAITPKTKLLFINSPSNPTGQIYTPQDWEALGGVLKKHPNIIIFLDDIYEHIIWGPEKFTNLLNICPDLYNQTLTINGVSKSYAMTGWRIGYAGGPKDLIAAMRKIQGQSTSCPCSIAQAAAVAALNHGFETIKPMVKVYQQRHDLVIQQLNQIPGIHALNGNSTFYAFPNVEGLIHNLGLNNDVDLAKYLMEQALVAVVPGTAFGTPGHIRLSFATSDDILNIALERIKKAVV